MACSSSSDAKVQTPVCVIVLGMAGSGKTTLVKKLTAHLYAKKKTPYVINLDPAVKETPYPANVDICDTVKYKEVMREYKLGPNGAILTSLNLFATRFDQLLTLLSKRKSECKYIVMDTPGQIEVFTWSASGTIITETLASSFPTVIAYVMDSTRNVNPVTFMSNMLYACSILYKTKLPFVIVLNKADVVDPSFAVEWMRDFEKFEEALGKESSYSADLSRSLSLVLDDFYNTLEAVAVSSTEGTGLDELLSAFEKGKSQYEKEYKPEYDRLVKEKDNAILEEQAKQLERVKLDIAKDGQTTKGPRGELPFHIGGQDFEEEQVLPADAEGEAYERFNPVLLKKTNSKC